jgi:hypothetical protein
VPRAIIDGAGVDAALLYYADHKDEIDADFAEDERLATESERERLESVDRRIPC